MSLTLSVTFSSVELRSRVDNFDRFSLASKKGQITPKKIFYDMDSKIQIVIQFQFKKISGVVLKILRGL